MHRFAQLILFSFLVPVGCLCAQSSVELNIDEAIERDLKSNESHAYSLTLSAGQFVYGFVDQQTVDVIVTVLDPKGDKVSIFDTPARGPEPFQFNTEHAGVHHIEVQPFEEAEGAYAIKLSLVEPIAASPEKKVDQLMAMYTGNVPGGVVAVVQDGAIVFAKGYGMANLEYGAPNLPSTPYHVASVSKQFTAFAITMLAAENKLSLEDPIHKYIPGLADFGHTITLRHLLNHTSGLRDQWSLWAMSGGRMDDVIRQEDLFRLVLRQRELNFPPGSRYRYSNTGYMLLAKVVEKVTGEAFGAWMQDNVFGPLAMHSTQVYDDHERIVAGRAYSYGNRGSGLKKAVLSYANAGATSLFTTVEDLAKWLRNFKTNAVGGTEVWEMMQTRGILTDGDTLNYALGIVVDSRRGLRRIQHGGADAGYRTMVSYYPKIDAGVIVFSNLGEFNPNRISAEVAQIFFPDNFTGEDASRGNTASNNSPSPEAWNPDGLDLAKYAGRYYSHELETFYTIVVEHDQLVADHVRHGHIVLSARSKDVFRSNTWFFREARFGQNQAGAVSEMHVSNGRVTDLRFEKVD